MKMHHRQEPTLCLLSDELILGVGSADSLIPGKHPLVSFDPLLTEHTFFVWFASMRIKFVPLHNFTGLWVVMIFNQKYQFLKGSVLG